MGCDIHIFIEREVGDTWIPLRKYDAFYAKHPEWGYEIFSLDGWYSGRNYELFGILAAVRREPENIIDVPRGLPADCSEGVKERSDEWGTDAHSHSHFTLAELVAFDWTSNKIQMEGVVGSKAAKAYKNKGIPPTRWSAWSADVNDEERLEWEITAESYCAEFMSLIEDLKTLGNPDKVRIVFWFDN